MTTFSINENKNAKRTANPIRQIVISNDATIVFKFSIVVMILIVSDFTRYKYHAMKPIPSNFLKEHFLWHLLWFHLRLLLCKDKKSILPPLLQVLIGRLLNCISYLLIVQKSCQN